MAKMDIANVTKRDDKRGRALNYIFKHKPVVIDQ